MPEKNEEIFQSPPSQPDDRFWLEEGRKMFSESLPAIRSAAASMIIALGVLQGIYLGILGFGEFIPKSYSLFQKLPFVFPLIFWMASLYLCLEVMMTRKINIYWHSPDDIRNTSAELLQSKQRQLTVAFWALVLGMFAGLALLLLRL